MAALGDQRGAVVALDPLTGGVLAMVSNPSYDANLFVEGISYPIMQSSAAHWIRRSLIARFRASTHPDPRSSR
ncbi:MAG: hypothetical protein CM15mP25_4810 [Gammaproteobacteria bacterium]|nr:MAG: hypothetical protein CM15mP25_4810 [Gammaproteobacteria bacterium]